MPHLALPAFLLGRNNLEVTIIQRILRLWLLYTRTALLSNLTPTTSRLILCRARCIAIIDDTLVGQLTASQELLGKMAAINVVSC